MQNLKDHYIEVIAITSHDKCDFFVCLFLAFLNAFYNMFMDHFLFFFWGGPFSLKLNNRESVSFWFTFFYEQLSILF